MYLGANTKKDAKMKTKKPIYIGQKKKTQSPSH
jgi:hypothetical protein